MLTNLEMGHIVMFVILAELVVSYLYWRLVLDIRPNYSFRAYDLLFVTIVATLLLGRIVGVVSNPSAFEQASFGDYFRIWDLQFNYFGVLLIPAIAFQFFVFNVEIFPDWKDHISKFLLFGELFALPVFIGQVVRAVITSQSQEVFVLHAALLGWLLICLLLTMVKLMRDVKLLTFPLLSASLIGGVVVITMLLQGLRDPRTLLLNAIFLVLLLTVVVYPFFKREQRLPVRQLPIK